MIQLDLATARRILKLEEDAWTPFWHHGNPGPKALMFALLQRREEYAQIIQSQQPQVNPL